MEEIVRHSSTLLGILNHRLATQRTTAGRTGWQSWQPVVSGSLPETCTQRLFAACTMHLGKLPRWTGWQPVVPSSSRSRAPHVGACAGIDLDCFAFFDEKRDVDGFSGLQLRRLGDVAGRVTPNAFRR